MAYQSEIEKLEARFQEKPEQWFAALADAYRKNGDLDLALEILQQWIPKRPNYTSGHIVLGRVYVDRQQDPDAHGAFQRVLELDAENIIAIKSLSDIAERAGRTDEARRWLTRLLEIDPMNDEAAGALAKLGAAGEAVETVEAAAVDEAGAAEAVEAAPAPAAGVEGFEPAAQEETSGAGEALTIERASQASMEATFLAETTGEAEESVEPAASPAPAAEEAGVGEDLGLGSFDDSLGWDAGERISRSITQEDLAAAERAREEALASAAEFIAGIEHVEHQDVVARVEEEGGGDLPLIMPEDVAAPEGGVAEEPGEREPEPVVTETMAELYAKQGLVHEARDIYRQLAEQHPDDVALARRLEELDAAAHAAHAAHAAPAEAAGAAPRGRVQRFSVAVTGGQSARDLLRSILSGGAAPPARQSPPAPPAAGTMLDEAYGDAPAGEPTRRASSDVSLAAVFGEEPEPAAPDAAAPPAPGGGGGGFSFDEFFGRQPPQPPRERDATERKEGDDDFTAWLKGLRT